MSKKNPLTPSGFEPATFQFVAQCLNQLRHCLPHSSFMALLPFQQSTSMDFCATLCIFIRGTSHTLRVSRIKVTKERHNEVNITVFLYVLLGKYFHMFYVILYFHCLCRCSMWRAWGRIEVCTGCWWGHLRERGHCGDQGVDGRVILMLLFGRLGGGGVVGTGWS
jgi:hypothetical protein